MKTRCLQHPSGRHRYKTVTEQVTKKFAGGEFVVTTTQACRNCGATHSFETVQQSTFTEKVHGR